MSWSETLTEETSPYFQEPGLKKKHFLLLVFRKILPCYPPTIILTNAVLPMSALTSESDKLLCCSVTKFLEDL